MKKLVILVMAMALVIGMSLGALAGVENTGDDPLGEEGAGWLINEGSLEGWEDSNFETLSESETGTSTEVGTGITVDGIKVAWAYPDEGSAGKGGPEDRDWDQEINYTIPAYAEIPCYLEMNLFGNGAYMNATNVGEGATTEVTGADHWMLFDTNYGGVVDGNWNFVDDFSPEDVVDEQSDRYIQGCDIFTANLFANVPYGFDVSSEGLGEDGKLPIQMRTTQEGIDITEENNNNDIDAWSATETLDADGTQVGAYSALEEAQINMQFRVPFDQVAAGIYEGEVTFSMYSM